MRTPPPLISLQPEAKAAEAEAAAAVPRTNPFAAAVALQREEHEKVSELAF